MPRRLVIAVLVALASACGGDAPTAAETVDARFTLVIPIDARTARDTGGTIEVEVYAERNDQQRGPTLLDRRGIALPLASDSIVLDVPLATCLRDTSLSTAVPSGRNGRRCIVGAVARRVRDGTVRDDAVVPLRSVAVGDTVLRATTPLRLASALRIELTTLRALPVVPIDTLLRVERSPSPFDLVVTVRDAVTGDVMRRPIRATIEGQGVAVRTAGDGLLSLTTDVAPRTATLRVSVVGAERLLPIVVVPQQLLIDIELDGEGAGVLELTGTAPCSRTGRESGATRCRAVVDEGTTVVLRAVAGPESVVARTGIPFLFGSVCVEVRESCTFVASAGGVLGRVTFSPTTSRLVVQLTGDGAGRLTFQRFGGLDGPVTLPTTCVQQIGVTPSPCIVTVPYRSSILVSQRPEPGSRWRGFGSACPLPGITECPLMTTRETVLVSGFERDPTAP